MDGPRYCFEVLKAPRSQVLPCFIDHRRMVQQLLNAATRAAIEMSAVQIINSWRWGTDRLLIVLRRWWFALPAQRVVCFARPAVFGGTGDLRLPSVHDIASERHEYVLQQHRCTSLRKAFYASTAIHQQRRRCNNLQYQHQFTCPNDSHRNILQKSFYRLFSIAKRQQNHQFDTNNTTACTDVA